MTAIGLICKKKEEKKCSAFIIQYGHGGWANGLLLRAWICTSTRGHTATTWTEICPFLTPFLRRQFLYPERGQKQTFFDPFPPHLVHVVIECPLADQFFTRTAGPVSLHELWKTPKIWISYLSLNQCNQPLTNMEIIKVSFHLHLTNWFLFSFKK